MRIIVLLGIVGFLSCQTEEYQEDIPIGFPSISYPEDNYPTVERVKLGRSLFFDPILSKDSTIACSSCHLPEFAYADTVSVSPGVEGLTGKRNAYSLLNVAYQKALFMEGGVPNLELQALAPLGDESEQQMLISEAAKRLSRIENYQELARKAYDRDIDPYVITRSLAAFERTLISGHSRYDKYMEGDQSALSINEQKGMELFFGKANCSSCHSGFLFTNQEFENIGLYEKYEDMGRMRLTDDTLDKGKFKVPGLRNVSKTAPYMHDGSIKHLSEVIEHFNNGGGEHQNKSPLIKELHLDSIEKTQLLNFLFALEDTVIIGDF
ncbi:MAG: cytochrome c peroxidase [Bacteroidota bacterium]